MFISRKDSTSWRCPMPSDNRIRVVLKFFENFVKTNFLILFYGQARMQEEVKIFREKLKDVEAQCVEDYRDGRDKRWFFDIFCANLHFGKIVITWTKLFTTFAFLWHSKFKTLGKTNKTEKTIGRWLSKIGLGRSQICRSFEGSSRGNYDAARIRKSKTTSRTTRVDVCDRRQRS